MSRTLFRLGGAVFEVVGDLEDRGDFGGTQDCRQLFPRAASDLVAQLPLECICRYAAQLMLVQLPDGGLTLEGYCGGIPFPSPPIRIGEARFWPTNLGQCLAFRYATSTTPLKGELIRNARSPSAPHWS
jgi:hypothetical protein